MANGETPHFPGINDLEAEIGIPNGFLASLLGDGSDDWSFVVKLHAVAEAAFNHLLIAAVGREELADLFASLPMGDPKRGKIALAAKLSLIDSNRERFFRALGRIRNRFAHDVKNVGLRIEDFARSLPPQDEEQFWRDLAGGHTVERFLIDFDQTQVPAIDFARRHPRFIIWVASMSALSLVYRVKSLDDANRAKFVEYLSSLKPLRTVAGSAGRHSTS